MQTPCTHTHTHPLREGTTGNPQSINSSLAAQVSIQAPSSSLTELQPFALGHTKSSSIKEL